MIKKIVLFCCIGLFIACGTHKPIAKKPVAINEKSSKTTTIKNQTKEQHDSQILEATTRVKVTTQTVVDYIQKYKEIAKNDMKQFGIPASITLGQGILESGAGTGPLSTQANNHFGIKCHKEWTGPSVRYDDDEAQECFRKYISASESFRDHSLFLTSRERYTSLFSLEKNDYVGWCKGLKNAGYATDPNYATKLIALIERYQLHKYDTEVLGFPFVVKNDKSFDNSKEIATSNNDWHLVVKGDTLYSISKRYSISIEDLKKKNNIVDNGITLGQKLIVK